MTVGTLDRRLLFLLLGALALIAVLRFGVYGDRTPAVVEASEQSVDGLLSPAGLRDRYTAAYSHSHERASPGDDPERPERPVVLRGVGIDQVGERHRDGRAHVRVRRVDEPDDLGVGVGEVHGDVRPALGIQGRA